MSGVTDVTGSLMFASGPVPLSSGSDEWSAAFATILGIAFLAAISLIILYNRWNRPDMDSEHAAHILAQLNTFGGTGGGSVVVRSVADLADSDVIEDIRGLFHGEQPSEPTARNATWTAMKELSREVRGELGTRAPSVSRVPARVIQEAVLTLIFGAIAVVPIAAWREATKTGGGGVPNVGELITGGQVVLDATLSGLTAFPFTDILFALALSLGIIGASTIWKLWMVPPVILAVLAGAYWWLERRTDVNREISGPSIRGWTRRFVTLTVTIWSVGTVLTILAALNPFGILAGAILAVITVAVYVYLTRDPPITEHAVRSDGGEPEDTEDGGLAEAFGLDGTDDVEIDSDGPPDGGERGDDTPSPDIRDYFRGVNWKHAALSGIIALGIGGKMTAFLAALAVGFTVTSRWIRRTIRRWKTTADFHGRDTLALDIIHSVTVTMAALTLPLLIAYVIAAIGTGKLIQVASVVLAAPSPTVTAVGILAVVTALAAAIIFLDRFRDVRRGFRRGLSVQAVRTVLIARAFPALFTVIIAVLALGLGLNPVLAVAMALSAGIIARIAVMAYNFITLQSRNYSGRDKTAARVVISGRKVTDADGEPVFIADVNGHRTAHRRVDPLINQIQRDSRSLLRDGAAEKGSFPRYYYREGVKRGNVDMESVADELVGDIRTRFIANVKQTDADAPTIMDKLRSEYPENAIQKVIKTLKDRGRITRRDDRFQWMGE